MIISEWIGIEQNLRQGYDSEIQPIPRVSQVSEIVDDEPSSGNFDHSLQSVHTREYIPVGNRLINSFIYVTINFSIITGILS